ncbi:MAG: hypothetical protein HC831_20465 [Chloroflexia bacterium]|nr:hypothetical protein [Chloroflexia bacterium]
MFGKDIQAIDFKESKDIEAITQRNNKFSGCLGQKENALCFSNPNVYPGKPVRVIFGETMDDNMSYFQMFHKELQDVNPYFVASQGSISEGQIKLLQLTLDSDKVEFESFVFATDRDKAGEYYIAKILASIKTKEPFLNSNAKFNDLLISVHTQPSSKTAYCDFKFSFENNIDAIYTLGKLKEFFYEHNKSFNAAYGHEYEPFNLTIDDKLSVGTLSFDNTTFNWRVINSFLHKFKFGDKFFIRHRPLLKDFNEDLQGIKGIHKEYKIDNYYNNPKVTSIESDNLKRYFFDQTRGKFNNKTNTLKNIEHDFHFNI